MEPFSTQARSHRGHDTNPSAVRRGTFENKTWVAPDRSGSSTPFQSNHLGADAVEGVVAGEARVVLRALTLGPPSVPAMSLKWKRIPKYLQRTSQSQALAMNLYTRNARGA